MVETCVLTHDFLFHFYFLVQTDIPSIWIPHDFTKTLLMEFIVWLKYLPCYNFLKLACDTVSLKRPLVQLAKYPRAFVAADPQPWNCHFLIKEQFFQKKLLNLGPWILDIIMKKYYQITLVHSFLAMIWGTAIRSSFSSTVSTVTPGENNEVIVRILFPMFLNSTQTYSCHEILRKFFHTIKTE